MQIAKEKAIAKYNEKKKEEAKEAFQGQVNIILSEISTLSSQLKSAKNRLLELRYEEPEDLNIAE